MAIGVKKPRFLPDRRARCSWRVTYENDWGCTEPKNDTLEAIKQILKDNPLWCKTKAKVIPNKFQKIDDEILEDLAESIKSADTPGTRSVYPKVALANTTANNAVVLLKNGHARTVTWPEVEESNESDD